MSFTEEKNAITSCILNKEEDVAFGGNKYLFKVEGDIETGCIYYIDNYTKKDVVFDKNDCLSIYKFSKISKINNGKYYDMNNPTLLSFFEEFFKIKRDIEISDEAIKELNIDTSYTFTRIIQNIEDKKLKLKLVFHCCYLFNNYMIASTPDITDRKKYQTHFAGEKWDGYFIYYNKTGNKGFVNGELFHICGLWGRRDGTWGMPNLLDDNFYNTLNVNENNLKSSHNNTHTMSNYNSNPYQDRNIYANNTDYKQEFYHKFSDPWSVRNDVEKNGHIVNEFGEVFSREQVKEYKKWGVEINPDRNIHGDKTIKQLLKRK